VNSLAETVAAVEDAQFFGHTPSRKEAQNVLTWLIERHATSNGYRRSMCAPTEKDRFEGAHLFTGERLGPGAQTLHVLGEEAYRAFLVLSTWAGNTDMEPATAMSAGVKASIEHEYEGRYCCGPCSVALWRALAVGGYGDCKRRLELGMNYLRTKRDGKGRWGSIPLYYTLLTLSELDVEGAERELSYAASTCEQLLQRHATIVEPYASRRIAILERALSRSNSGK